MSTLRLVLAVAVLGFSLLFASSASATVILADSVADFSPTQGNNGWYYGYYDQTVYGPVFQVSDFQLMAQYLTNPYPGDIVLNHPSWMVQDGTYWTQLWANGAQPNGAVTSTGRRSEEQLTDLRWESDYSGEIEIVGHFAKIDTSQNSEGVTGIVYMNGTQIWSQYINGQDGTGVNYDISLAVQAGDVFDFQISPWQSTDWNDSTTFTSQVSEVPEPATMGLFGLGLAAVIARRRADAERAS
jgi:hypothetical protein